MIQRIQTVYLLIVVGLLITAMCLPLGSIILNILAIRAIGRDEVMVKAADRLR